MQKNRRQKRAVKAKIVNESELYLNVKNDCYIRISVQSAQSVNRLLKFDEFTEGRHVINLTEFELNKGEYEILVENGLITRSLPFSVF